jgi:hypothetical protein
MRRTQLLIFFVVLAGFCVAQDTNFPAGPQYLITTSSSMLLHPIATPSLSLGEALPATPAASAVETPSYETVPASAPSETFLGEVYWGENKPSAIVGRRLETPSMTAEETAGYMNAVANAVANQTSAPPAATQTGLEIPAGPGVIEITSTQLPANLPPSILDVGVTGTTDPQSLLTRGYGLSLGEVAAYWKTHKRTAPHIYTNEDVVRTSGSQLFLLQPARNC